MPNEEFERAADYAAECSRALLTAAAEMTAAQEQLQKATAAYDKADAEHKRAFADALRIARAGTTPPANPA